ncbi:MAG: tetratricopeptide repeat protein [Myxococcaceae bacterium]
MFFSKKPYDRSHVLAAAEKARGKGKKNKAINEYRKILAQDPNDAAIHGKIAPLLAQTEQLTDAWKSFVIAAQAHIDKGFVEKGIAVYHQAAVYFPRSSELWENIAKLHFKLGHKADSVKTLVKGQRFFQRFKQDWPQAIRLLRQAVSLDPINVPATVELSSLLRKSGEKKEALALIDELLPKVGGAGKKQLLAARFRTAPGFSAFWRWLRA